MYALINPNLNNNEEKYYLSLLSNILMAPFPEQSSVRALLWNLLHVLVRYVLLLSLGCSTQRHTETAYCSVFSQVGELPTFRPGSSHMSNLSFNSTPTYNFIYLQITMNFTKMKSCLILSAQFLSSVFSVTPKPPSKDALIPLAF